MFLLAPRPVGFPVANFLPAAVVGRNSDSPPKLRPKHTTLLGFPLQIIKSTVYEVSCPSTHYVLCRHLSANFFFLAHQCLLGRHHPVGGRMSVWPRGLPRVYLMLFFHNIGVCVGASLRAYVWDPSTSLLLGARRWGCSVRRRR